MSDTNYVILTVASVNFSYRETMTKLMSQHSKDLIANAGAKGTRFGSIGTCLLYTSPSPRDRG